MTPRCRAAGLVTAALLWLTIPVAAGAEEAAGAVALPAGDLDVTASEMARPAGPSAAFGATPVAFPVPRPETLRTASAAPALSLRPVERDPWAAPALRWDGHPEDMDWTLATMAALRGPGAALVRTVPQDIASWCPGYEAAGSGQRRAFWAGLVSALAWHESTHDEGAVGGGGQWFGLVQISPATARFRGCSATSGQALLDGEANLRCGLRIMGATVPRDGVVSQGMRGVAADWGPFHSSRKREDMRQWVRAQDYCQVPPEALRRPIERPQTF
jgi:hypothetical protein